MDKLNNSNSNSNNNESAGRMRDLYGFAFRKVDKRMSEKKVKDKFLVVKRDRDIGRLWQLSHEIINLHTLGYKNVQIAKMLNIAPCTVSNSINSSLGAAVIAEKRKDRDGDFEELREDVMDLTKKSLKIYHEIFDEPDETGRVSLEMKRKAADTVVLELSGLKVPTKVDTRKFTTSATLDEIEEFKKRGIEAAKDCGRIIEIDGEGSRNSQ